jgi:Nuclease-related domain
VERTGAGSSALDGYRRALAARRRRKRVCAAAILGSLGVGWAALNASAGWRPVLLGASCVLVAVALVAFPRSDPGRWSRGAAGEVATARILDALSARRWVVWHDLPVPARGSRANVDHLVIGPTGVWVVDTKTSLSHVRTGWRTVRFGGRVLDAGPTRWEAEVVAEKLGVDVRPIIAVHATGFHNGSGRAGRVPVVPAEQLVRRIQRGQWLTRRRLDPAAVDDVARRAEEVFGGLTVAGSARG